ncbi:hypothetical protein RHSIM_RhsimUnG0257000 [Rhododendron simsii]|uniref:RING-type E3 ubiquitin transferase n=1 Tax=Rhododendron simsii TaxID=118357 RepID=A0A834FSZ7_RHOSS|nr:hypothetical protein RHSIM_RhsimUnG0257000 [Rhododendron simsii]
MKGGKDVKYKETAANNTKIAEVLTSMSSCSIERDQEKALDRQKKAEAREMQLHYLAMMNEREQRKEDHAILSMDVSTFNPTQKAYYEGPQREIIARRGMSIVAQGARIAGLDRGVEELDGVAAGSRQERRRWIREVHDRTGVEREKWVDSSSLIELIVESKCDLLLCDLRHVVSVALTDLSLLGAWEAIRQKSPKQQWTKVGLLDEEKILPLGKDINAVGIRPFREGIVEIKSCYDLPRFLLIPFEEDDKDRSIWFLDHYYHEMGIPTKAYCAVEEVKENATRKSQKVFVRVPPEIAADAVEEIGMQHGLRKLH